MTTQQLYFNQESKSQNASGVAVIFFLLGAPNIYSALRKRSQQPAASYVNLLWTLGLGILLFVSAGTAVCLNGLA
jgi:hypothetical protein